MARGLLWLPLLIIFVWLAWSGWNEYQKIEAYRLWAEEFDQAKYDIYAVLGQKNEVLTWGKPTRSGPVNLQSFSLRDVDTIRLLVDLEVVDLEVVDLDNLPTQGNAVLEFILKDNNNIKIPFTEVGLAAQWTKYLQNLP